MKTKVQEFQEAVDVGNIEAAIELVNGGMVNDCRVETITFTPYLN